MRRILLLFLLLLGTAGADSFVLVKDGQPQCAIVLSKNAGPDEKLAAQELSEHLKLISGATVETRAAAERPILIQVDQRLKSAFRLEVDGNRVRIVGQDGYGCLMGAYELLEQLGVRWYFPGEAGRIYPSAKSLTLKTQDLSQTPSFRGRNLHGGLSMDKQSWDVWVRRIRCGGPFFPASHGLKVPEAELEAEPALRGLIRGERVGKQLCITHPRAVELVAERARTYFRSEPESEWMGLGPKDGSGFCQCERCSALDVGTYDKHARKKPLTDRYIWFLNQVAEALADEFPDKKLAFYAYAAIARPPVKVKPHPNLVPAIAPINYCRIHGVDHPLCPESREVLQLWREWKALCPQVWHRGYWFNLADPGLNFPMVHRMRREIPLAKEIGLEGFRVECFHPWANQLPSLWVASRLMWNHEADVDALLTDFFTHYYGEKAAPHMEKAFRIFEDALDKAPFHTGSSWDFPNIYPELIFERVEPHYQAALKVADAEQRARIEWTRKGTQFTRDFNAMLNARNQHRWTEARKHLDSANAIVEELTTPEPPMLSRRYAANYMKRFFAPATEEGYAIQHDHRVLHQFPHLWKFKLDPEDQGSSAKWFQESHPSWGEIRSSLSWSTQNLRYYAGPSWYEATFTAKKPTPGKKVYLWFATNDEPAQIWLNGEQLANYAGRPFKPFEVEVTAPLRAQNRLTLRITNARLSELGTGGIMGPVMLYER